MKQTPIHKHECDRCTFLGTFRGADMYFCRAWGAKRVTLILRDGSEGPEYDSLPLHEGLNGPMADLVADCHYGAAYAIALHAARAWSAGVLSGSIRMAETIGELSGAAAATQMEAAKIEDEEVADLCRRVRG